MALQTDFNVAPYYDDYDPKKDYYRILFQPGVAVQARELNQLQSILQNQIEKFGDNIFKRGTIIEGCNISLHPILPYVKIKDVQTDGAPVNISEYDNLYVKNSANLSAFIVKTIAGYESRTPDLNTLYVKYNNSGDDGDSVSFSSDDVLTVYDPSYPVFKFKVVDGSSRFSNSDSVVITSAIAVQNSTGGATFPAGAFTINDVIQNGVANATIMEVNTTANSEALILKIRPLAGDLKTANSILWKFKSGDTIRNTTSGNTASISSVIGAGAEAAITTDSLGKITSITPTSMGSGYYVQPYISVSINNTTSGITNSDINQLDVVAQNFLTNITVANTALAAIGTGYGVTVDEGTIYQKGFFSRVDRQLIVVSKYSNTAFSNSVGFYTAESIVTSNQDQTLLDNATGTFNYTAPGADRLSLKPTLYVSSKSDAESNTEFLPIVEFADGMPYKSNRRTVYNLIGDEMAKRTFEESGDYVLDQFLLTTKDSTTFSDTSDVFKILVDPGTAYIRGYRVETTTNYAANVDKGLDTFNNQNATVRIGYGNFILVKELGGIFQFNYGDSVTLYNTAAGYVTNSPGSAITPTGTAIGTARMRSLILDSGEPGTSNAVYRLYLFDIEMNQGKNFADARSAYFVSGSVKGIADIVLNDSGVAALIDSKNSALLFKSINAVQSANGITYTYRTMNQSSTANSTGYISLASPGGSEYFPYATGTLSQVAKRDLLVISLGNYQALTNVAGTLVTTTNSPVVTGTSTNFLTGFSQGDYVKIANSTASVVKQISQITNATSLTLTSNAGINLSGNGVIYFPNNVPISITNRETRTVELLSNGQMNISLATNIANASTRASSSAAVAVVYNVTANSVVPTTKSIKREVYARIRIANNSALYGGPWALGVSDAFRLRGVYSATGSNTTISVGSNTMVNSTSDFIIYNNTPFANGDSVKYTGTTPIGGLTSGTIYYVVNANSSGFSVAATRNGSTINITGTSSEETHTFEGPTLYFTENTYGVTDVTNDFYIDNNQKEDYLDTSYLYLKPGATKPASNKVLLVKFDAFQSSAGVKTAKSYPINDSANLAMLSNSAINTMEIPEMVGVDGKYYDLRDQFDFRPTSANTIPYTSDAANTLITNPKEPTTANRFSSTEQKFPVPDTNLTANVTYYVGRNDRVVLNKSGQFVVVKGAAGVLDAFPPEPRDSITIQYLRIPPYPSLPQALSSEMIEIVDTKVANEKYSRRKDNFKISTPIDPNQRARIQTKNYKMSDIASLEKRLKDLEYYVSFTLAETVAKTRFIPSSVSTIIDRYKFGFVVDPFTNYSMADTTNPEFSATIDSDRLLPKKTELNLEFVVDGSVDPIITTPYTEYTLINQSVATDGPVIVPPVVSGGTTTTPTPTPTPTPTVTGNVNVISVTQRTGVVIESQKNTSRSDNPPYVYDEFFYTFSSLAGPAELYINSRDNYIAIEIFQSDSQNGPWTTSITSAGAQAITNADISVKGLSTLNGTSVEHPGKLERKSSGPLGGWIEDQFKIIWTHNPTSGKYYKVRVYKGGHHGGLFGGQGKSGTYGYKLFYPTDTVTENTITVANPSGFDYVGTVYNVSPNAFTLTMSFDFFWGGYTSWGGGYPNGVYAADSQKFTIQVTGLKPNTIHNFIFAGEDQTSKCSQVRNSTTNTTGLKSDSNGVLTFDFYYDAGINEATTDLEQQNKLLAAVAGVKQFKIQSSDGNSIASGSIDLKYYTSLTPALISSFNNLNTPAKITTTTSEYDYASDLSKVVDKTTTSVTPTVDYTNIDWSGVNFKYYI